MCKREINKPKKKRSNKKSSGPFPTPTHGGFKYCFIFTYDFSRYGHMYLINENSSDLDMFKIYKVEVEKQLDINIKIV